MTEEGTVASMTGIGEGGAAGVVTDETMSGDGDGNAAAADATGIAGATRVAAGCANRSPVGDGVRGVVWRGDRRSLMR